MKWDFAPHARLPHLDTEFGRYSLRREGRREVRAFLDNKRTTFVGSTEEVKVMVERAVRSQEVVAEEKKPQSMECPFCGEKDFDAIGLKGHLLHGDCEPFNKLERTTRL